MQVNYRFILFIFQAKLALNHFEQIVLLSTKNMFRLMDKVTLNFTLKNHLSVPMNYHLKCESTKIYESSHQDLLCLPFY